MRKMNVIAVVGMATLFGGSATAATSQTVSARNPNVRVMPSKKMAARKKISNKVISTKVSKKALHPAATKNSAALAVSDSLSSTNSSATRVTMPTTGTTATNASAVQPAAAKPNPFSAAVNFYYYGSSLQEPLRQYQTDQSNMQGYAGAPVTLETHMVFGYKLTKNLTISANPYFDSFGNYHEYNSDTGGYDSKEGKAFRLTLPFLKLGVGQFYKAGKFKWNGDFRVYPGISDFAKELGLPLYLRTGQNFTYGLTDKLTLAAYNTIRYYKYNDSKYVKSPGTRDFRITAMPALEYQAADTLGITAGYAVDVFHPNNAGLALRDWSDTGDGAYAEVGVGWDVTKRVNLNPYIDVYLQNLKAYNTMIGANVAITIL